MNLLPILVSLLVYLIQDFPEKKSFNGSGLAMTAPLMACDRRSDSLELVKFYNATGGPNWTNKWYLDQPMNTWWGIFLNSQGCVTKIIQNFCIDNFNSPGNNLTGNLTNLNLQFLELLNLYNNKIGGNLLLFNTPNLKVLNLSRNNFIGTIPNFSYSNLEYLALSGNRLTGNIPNFNLPVLEYLILGSKGTGTTGYETLPLFQWTYEYGSNNLSGPIPNFDKLPNLKYLYLYNNHLSGSFPNFDKLLNLNYLSLGSNLLSGPIPNFDNLPNLWGLILSNNLLTGPIPNFDKLPNLIYLWLGNNQLSGPIPNFDKLPNLTELLLGNNQLSGIVPNFENSRIGKSDTVLIDLYDNYFTFSSIIKNINNIRSSGYTYAPQKKIYSDTTITIPPNTPYTLDLRIDDTVTTSTYVWFKNDVLYKTIKGSNKLPFVPFTVADAGTYTVKISNPLAPQLTLESHPIRLVAGPQLVCDRMLDSLELVKFYTATGGTNWWKNWDLSKPISSWHGIELEDGCVVSIDLEDTVENNSTCCTGSGNNLVGTIMPLNLPFLKLLDLQNNKLTESIPEFENIPNLVTLKLDRNQLTGSIPNFDSTPKLRVLRLEDNKLSGNIPLFNKVPELEELVLSNNELTGSIPSFDKVSELRRLSLSVNQLTGIIPEFDMVPKLQHLALSYNQLSGFLPLFDKVPDLLTLWLDSNQLSGSIHNFENVAKLQMLHLSSNLFTGSLPAFDKLMDLRILLINNNKLNGKIPDFDKVPRLRQLYVNDNQLIGNVPNYGNLPELEVLNLHNNLFEGNFPKLEKCQKLKAIYLNYNYFSGIIPDFYLTHLSLSDLAYEVNRFTFQSMIHNLYFNKNHVDIINKNCPTCTHDTLRYAQQRKIYFDTTISIPTCSEYILDLKIDDTVTTSTYAWFKDGVPDTIIKGSNKRRFTNFSPEKAGTYTVKITNPLAPQLTLESHPIRLLSSGTVTNINNPRDSSLSCGLSFRFPVITGQNLGSDAAYFTGPGRTGTRYASGQAITTNATLYAHTSSGGCFDEDTFSIRFTNPVLIARQDTARTQAGKPVSFDVLANDIIPAGLPTQVSIDNPANGSILYSNSSGRGTHTPKIGFAGTEVLNYTTCIVDCPESCKSSTLTIIVEGPCGDRNSIVLPNVIFPTGSGVNRYFIVEAITKCPDAWGPKPHKFEVFNRWGGLVYKNENYLNDWDGTNTAGQPLPEGTYYYLLDLGSVAAPVRGYVVIMR